MSRSGTSPLRSRITRRSVVIALSFTALFLFGISRLLPAQLVPGIGRLIASATPIYLLLALVASTATYPLRGLRWRRVLHAAGLVISRRAATEILALSFWVNVLLPAKLGDVYRAWLLKRNGATSFGGAMGSVVAERLVDLATVALLGGASALVAFNGRLSTTVSLLVSIALLVAAGTLALLLLSRGLGAKIVKRLPLPARVREPLLRAVTALQAGTGGSMVAQITPYSLGVWALESLRLGLVAAALGLFAVSPEVGMVGISAVVFTALVSAVLTVVPATPAGIGIVEIGTFGILFGIFGMAPEQAAALALLDRVVGVGSLLLGGAVLFAWSPYRRGVGRLR
ncbi:MAG: lysylphosphatidylglycerol synthase transmembrane domain-containing protein [Candidatus Limnocylindrus sp.]